MARFFFHLRDDLDVDDDEGVELPDHATARNEAVRNARALACDQVLQGRLNLRRSIVVKDEQGQIVTSVTFANAVEVRD